MLSGQRFFILNFPDYVSKTILWPPYGNIMDVMNIKQTSTGFKHQDLRKKRKALPLSLSSARLQVKLQVTSNAAMAPFLNGNSFEGRTSSDQAFLYGEVEEEDDDDDEEFSGAESPTEMLRRKRIGLANKGKIPWNKGVTHNEETRQKIKQRTIDALSNPKVRKKMSECYRDRSDECKEKISVSLRHVWAKRLNFPRQREEFYMSWFDSIALAAKKGGKDQKELGWDSYAIAEELVRQKQQQELHEVKAKVKDALRAKRNKKNKTDEFLALGRDVSGHMLEDQPKKKVKRKKCSKSDHGEETVVPDDSNLQTRLSKIKKPVAVTIKVDTNSSLAWEKLDLEYIKRKNRQKISLADQIQAAKKRREKLMERSNCIAH